MVCLRGWWRGVSKGSFFFDLRMVVLRKTNR